MYQLKITECLLLLQETRSPVYPEDEEDADDAYRIALQETLENSRQTELHNGPGYDGAYNQECSTLQPTHDGCNGTNLTPLELWNLEQAKISSRGGINASSLGGDEYMKNGKLMCACDKRKSRCKIHQIKRAAGKYCKHGKPRSICPDPDCGFNYSHSISSSPSSSLVLCNY